ncbi:hypothetical protein ACLOJK_000918 [Asimina triloba]
MKGKLKESVILMSLSPAQAKERLLEEVSKGGHMCRTRAATPHVGSSFQTHLRYKSYGDGILPRWESEFWESQSRGWGQASFSDIVDGKAGRLWGWIVQVNHSHETHIRRRIWCSCLKINMIKYSSWTVSWSRKATMVVDNGLMKSSWKLWDPRGSMSSQAILERSSFSWKVWDPGGDPLSQAILPAVDDISEGHPSFDFPDHDLVDKVIFWSGGSVRAHRVD